MNLYFDASALVKVFVEENESAEMRKVTEEAGTLATSLITRAEVESALAKGVRMGNLRVEDGDTARDAFRQRWRYLQRLPVTEPLVAQAGRLTWSQGLRGYDSIQLATALTWQEHIASPVTFACFDRRLQSAAAEAGLEPYPRFSTA